MTLNLYIFLQILVHEYTLRGKSFIASVDRSFQGGGGVGEVTEFSKNLAKSSSKSRYLTAHQ